MKAHLPVICVLLLLGLHRCSGHEHDGVTAKIEGDEASGVNIECNSNNIQVTLDAPLDFNGMIYPKGLSKNSTCMAEYSNVHDKVVYTLPLRSCNTMSTDVDDGVEYFNTVVVQPHRKLVTNQGRGFHIRCRYQTKEKTITNFFNVSMLGTTPLVATAPMPGCTMKIFVGDSEEEVVAENVKIGDPLTLVIAIDPQEVYGMRVTNCLVRDGLNWGEQPLINNEGCPVDGEILGPFDYTLNKTRASVTFQAHKFPYTASVYYQCNVRLCLKASGGCDDVPPLCDDTRHNLRRRRRDVDGKGDLKDLEKQEQDVRDLSIEVFSGLYVNEVSDLEESEVTAQPSSLPEDQFCVSTRKFAIGIAIAGVLLMLAVLLLVACILHRRRRRKGSSTAGSSIYSGPYSNHAYSRD
ncbi:cuticlin-1-like isoform X2 [Ornithodoros turicata]|uniref:cuticlin-1-like isoform X2 n=1 Tax=Ornithodoros turicata TaxID=34597 RepID=UPI0031388E29